MSKLELNDSIGFLIGTTFRGLAAELNHRLSKEEAGVSFEHWILLVRLWDKDGQSQQEIAKSLQKDKTSITRLLDHLEKHEYVKRVADTCDRRNKLIFLTSKGKKLEEKLIPVCQDTITQAREGIPENEMETCKKVLRKLRENLGLT
ncbi:MarR family transcriptional regulator [Cytophagaceae bacterium ABcell3]|nr:MarR family transcriptional regulator [Cytophagaceae bacterium ABcell3]